MSSSGNIPPRPVPSRPSPGSTPNSAKSSPSTSSSVPVVKTSPASSIPMKTNLTAPVKTSPVTSVSVSSGPSRPPLHRPGSASAMNVHSGGGEDWIFVQKKTFTRWANSYLSKQRKEIGDLSTDLEDGIKLGTLLEIISNEKIRLNQTPKIELQKLENIQKSLTFLKDKGFPLVNIGSKDIFSGNEKIILGLLWVIILRFEVGDQDGKNGLLLWVQRTCKGYREVDPPNVQNFSSDWNTGLPFCAIIHKFRPDLLDYSKLSANNAEYNCELAFSVAHEKLGIARMLDVGDVAGNAKPDDKSIIAYVVQFFKLFAKANKNEGFIKSIRNAVEVTKRHDALMDKYNEQAQALVLFCSTSVTTSTSKNTSEVREELEKFTSYMRSTKPKMQAMRAEVEGVSNQLVNSKRNNKRPEFMPSITLSELTTKWQTVELAEQQRERILLDKYSRFQQVDAEVAKIRGGNASMKAWIEERKSKFSTPLSPALTLTQFESELEVQDGFDLRLAQYQLVLASMKETEVRIQDLGKEEHEECAKIALLVRQLDQDLGMVKDSGGKYRSQLDAKMQAEKRAVLAERAFKRTSDALAFDVDQVESRAKLDVVVTNAADVEELNKNLAELRKETGKAKATLETELKPMLSGPLAGRGGSLFADTAKKHETRLGQLETTLNSREQALKTKLAEEKSRDELRTLFASRANSLALEIDRASKALSGAKGTLEAQLEEIRTLHGKLLSGPVRTELEALDGLAVKCDQAGIVHNPNTPHTIFSLRAQYDQVVKAASDEEQAINAQILAKKSLEVSPEQLKEITEVFAFFDADNSGLIGLKELQQACTGAGIDLGDESIAEKMAVKKADMQFTVEDFVDFMLAEMKTGDTPDAVLNAFTQLGEGATTFSVAQIEAAFASERSLKEYLLSRMPEGDFKRFVVELFSR